MTTEPERDLRATKPSERFIDEEFTMARREEIREAVLAAHPVAGRRPAPRVLIAAGVALVLAAGGAVGAVTALQPDQDHTPAVAQPSSTPSVATPSPSATAAPNDPSDSPPPAPAEVVTLDQVAEIAGRRAGPVKIAEDQFRHVVTASRQSDDPMIINDSYIAADGWTWRKDTENGRISWMLYKGIGDALDPTDLPTDSKRLERTLRSQHLGTDSETRGLFKLITEVVSTEVAPPKVRAAAIELLADLAERPVHTVPVRGGGKTSPDITITQGSIADRPAVGARFTDKHAAKLRYTVWFDAKTSEILRTDSVSRDGSLYSSEIRTRVVADNLPAEFVRVLGTKRVEKYPGSK